MISPMHAHTIDSLTSIANSNDKQVAIDTLNADIKRYANEGLETIKAEIMDEFDLEKMRNDIRDAFKAKSKGHGYSLDGLKMSLTIPQLKTTNENAYATFTTLVQDMEDAISKMKVDAKQWLETNHDYLKDIYIADMRRRLNGERSSVNVCGHVFSCDHLDQYISDILDVIIKPIRQLAYV